MTPGQLVDPLQDALWVFIPIVVFECQSPSWWQLPFARVA